VEQLLVARRRPGVLRPGGQHQGVEAGLRVHQEGRQAAQPRRHLRRDAADRAIKETVEADTEYKINELFNSPLRDSSGNWVPSYGEVRTHAPWSDRPPDVSLEEGEFTYRPNFKSCPVR